MKRFLFVTVLAVCLGWAAAVHHERKRGEEQQTRRIATEAACRTIVEAGLVRSCTIQSK